jgi:hypothetical protein
MAVLAVFQTSKSWVLESGQNGHFYELFWDVTVL